MPDEVVHVVEDAFHRLQHPQPDNPETDEDLANAAQVAAWKCERALHGRVHASAGNRHLTLTGTVDTEQQRVTIEAAVLGLNMGIKGLTNAIEIIGTTMSGDDKPMLPPVRHQMASEPMLYISRFCGIEPYSLTAALHEALDALDRRFAELNLTAPENVIVIYRNRLPESVMLDVGYIVPESVQVEGNDDFKLGRTPEGTMLAASARFGSHGLFDTHDQLVQQALLANLTPVNFAWQRFPLTVARRRLDHPAALLYLPTDSGKISKAATTLAN